MLNVRLLFQTFGIDGRSVASGTGHDAMHPVDCHWLPLAATPFVII